MLTRKRYLADEIRDVAIIKGTLLLGHFWIAPHVSLQLMTSYCINIVIILSNGYRVSTTYNTNDVVQKIPSLAIWKPGVAKNNANQWSLLEPQILVKHPSHQPICQNSYPTTGRSKFLSSCIHHRLYDNSLILVSLYRYVFRSFAFSYKLYFTNLTWFLCVVNNNFLAWAVASCMGTRSQGILRMQAF